MDIKTALDQFDWRLLFALPGKRNDAGKEVDVIIRGMVQPFILNDNRVSFGLPNASALYLGSAVKYYKEAKNLKYQIRKEIIGNNIPDNIAFSYIEKMMSSILFSFSAIEAFSNNEIPDEYIYYKEKKKDHKVLILAEMKKTIERCEPLEVKLCLILPKVFKTDSPKGTKEWQEFFKLKEIRDRIVHLKTEDQQDKQGQPEAIWQILFKEDVPNYPSIAKNIITYFYRGKEDKYIPRWITKFPNSF
jgi:hypothetical protein